jgi:hypothetical protein
MNDPIFERRPTVSTCLPLQLISVLSVSNIHQEVLRSRENYM